LCRLCAAVDLVAVALFPLSQLRRAAVLEGALLGIDFFAVVRMNPTPPGEVSIRLMRSA
jgi:hypothetical protein